MIEKCEVDKVDIGDDEEVGMVTYLKSRKKKRMA